VSVNVGNELLHIVLSMIGMRETITKDYDFCDGLKSSIYIRFCAILNTKTVGAVLTTQTCNLLTIKYNARRMQLTD
jgi:hypothetical protein